MNLTSNLKYPKDNSINITRQGKKETKEIIYNNDKNRFDPKENDNICDNISHLENTKQLLNDTVTKNNNDNLEKEKLNDTNEINNIGNNLEENNKNEKSLNENRNNNQRAQNCEKEHNYQNHINENNLAIDTNSEKQKQINIPLTSIDEHLKQKYDVNQTDSSDIYKQYENNDPQKLIEINKVKSHLNPFVNYNNNNNNNISIHEGNETNATNYLNLNEQNSLNEPTIRENNDSMNNKNNIPYEKIINNKTDVPSNKTNEEGITNKKENLQENNNNNDIENFNTTSNNKNTSTVTSENKNTKNDIVCFSETNDSNRLINVSEKHESKDNVIILNNSNTRNNNDEIIIHNDNPTGEGQKNSTDKKLISTNIQPRESNENNSCFGRNDNNSEIIKKNNEHNENIYPKMENQKTSQKTNKEGNIIQLIEIQSQNPEDCDDINNNSITLLDNNKINTISNEKNIKNEKDEENCEPYKNGSIKGTNKTAKELSENEKQKDSINTNFNKTKNNPLLDNINQHITDESQIDTNFNNNKSNIKLVQPINTDGELKQFINETNQVINNMNSKEENITQNKNIENNSLNITELPFSDNNNNKLFDNENQAYQNQKNKNEYKSKENSSNNNKETNNNFNNKSNQFTNKFHDFVDMPSLHTQNIITTASGENEQSNISKREISNNTNDIENLSRNAKKISTNNENENKFNKNTNTFKEENPNLIISQSLSNKELNKIGDDISFNPNTSNYKYTFENVCENDIDASEIKEEENECIVNNEKSKEDLTKSNKNNNTSNNLFPQLDQNKEQSANANEFTNSKFNNNNNIKPSDTMNNNKASNHLHNPKEKEKYNSNYSHINKEEIDDVKKLNSQIDSQKEKKELGNSTNKGEIPNKTESLTSDNNFINPSTKGEFQPTQTNNKENTNNLNNNNISFKNNQITGQTNKEQQIEKNTNSLNNVAKTNITTNNNLLTNTSPQDISTKSNQNHPQNSFKTNPNLLQIKTTKPSLSENTRYFSSNNNNESQKNIINNNNNHALQNENLSKQNNLLNPNTKSPSNQAVPLLNFSKLNQNESTLSNNLSIIPPKNKRNHSRVLSSPFLSESIFNSETGQFISQKSSSNINNNNNNDLDSKFKFPGSPILLSNKPSGIMNEETNPLLRACSSRDIIYLYQNKKQPIKSSTNKSNTLFNKTKPKPLINTYNISSIPFSYPTVHNAAPNSHRLNTLNTMCKDLQKTESNINDKQKNLQGRLQFLSKFVKDSNALSPPHNNHNNNNKANVINTDANLKTRNYETVALISSPRQQETNKKEIFYIKDNAKSILPPNALNYSKYGFFKSN